MCAVVRVFYLDSVSDLSARMRTSEGLASSQLFGGERRASPRVNHPFPVTLRRVNEMGETLRIETVLDNLSARGLFVRLFRSIALGAPISIGIRLSAVNRQGTCARVAARGVVKRVERMGNGQYGIAVEFVRHRML